MHEAQGYFCLVQYSEFPERAEYVNIGVVVFASGPPHIFCKFSQRASRVERAFNIQLGNHFQHLKESMEDRLRHEFGGGWDRLRIDKFIAMRSGKIRLSPARSVLVNNADALVVELFDKLVGEVPHLPRGQRVSTKLAQAFRSSGVESLLVKPRPVHLSGGVKIEVPFAYQNGAFNLIDSVSLAGEPDKALSRVSPLLIEGDLLFRETALNNPSRLVVVGDCAETQNDDFLDLIEGQMAHHNVKFYTMSRIEPLVSDIRRNYALHH
jgi:hypothetical protein